MRKPTGDTRPANNSVRIEKQGVLAKIVIDNPPVNVLSQSVRAGLLRAVEIADADSQIEGVVLVSVGKAFIAGGDISEFDAPPAEPHLPDVILRIEQARAPWLALIDGVTFGGGLEVALGARWRMATAKARFGLPETSLGLIPGAGGCVRLPRLVGATQAARITCLNQTVSAEQALEMGLIDKLIDNMSAESISVHVKELMGKQWPEPVLSRPAPAPFSEPFLDEIAQTISRRFRGQKAPGLALQAMRTGIELPVKEALKHERSTHLGLRDSAQSRALRHVFVAERAARKCPVEAEYEPVAQIGIIGGGIMGVGIGQNALSAGYAVTLIERNDAALEQALARWQKLHEQAIERGYLSAGKSAEQLARLSHGTNMQSLAQADLVIEAVYENAEIKREVFSRLSEVCGSETLLATNTSYLDPNLVAEVTQRPENVIGLHFFSPANVMKLVEVIRTIHTSPCTLARTWNFALNLGKIPVESGICTGFIGNRLLRVCREQAETMLLAGASPRQTDAAMRDFGMAMGPFEAQDMGGHDIAAAMRGLARAKGETVFAPIADRLVSLDRLGRKTGAGWYDYESGSSKGTPSETVAQIIEEERQQAKIKPEGQLDTDIIQQNLLAPMVSEAEQMLDEGMVASADAIDLVQILGYGFPRWQGGLMYWARMGEKSR